ncbi:basic proline-rich protein-like [Penaeus japonicus]|uniref:basic proline-rich protein-like n=1 Tax=Penaeus japonicus TaxID=27405 RepID=UPI001C716C4F|nr:basic proline-rich protein-like [Penaeus japonicus]
MPAGKARFFRPPPHGARMPRCSVTSQSCLLPPGGETKYTDKATRRNIYNFHRRRCEACLRTPSPPGPRPYLMAPAPGPYPCAPGPCPPDPLSLGPSPPGPFPLPYAPRCPHAPPTLMAKRSILRPCPMALLKQAWPLRQGIARAGQ